MPYTTLYNNITGTININRIIMKQIKQEQYTKLPIFPLSNIQMKFNIFQGSRGGCGVFANSGSTN